MAALSLGMLRPRGGVDVHVFVRIPCGKIWKLKRWIYGSRPVANAWEKDFAES